MNVTRKVGDREPISIKVTFPVTTDLTGLSVAFFMDAKDGTAKIAGASGTATDITPSGTTAKTVWRLSYAFDADDLDTTGAYKAEFEVDYGSGQKRYYPRGSDIIVVSVVAHPAAS